MIITRIWRVDDKFNISNSFRQCPNVAALIAFTQRLGKPVQGASMSEFEAGSSLDLNQDEERCRALAYSFRRRIKISMRYYGRREQLR